MVGRRISMRMDVSWREWRQLWRLWCDFADWRAVPWSSHRQHARIMTRMICIHRGCEWTSETVGQNWFQINLPFTTVFRGANGRQCIAQEQCRKSDASSVLWAPAGLFYSDTMSEWMVAPYNRKKCFVFFTKFTSMCSCFYNGTDETYEPGEVINIHAWIHEGKNTHRGIM